MGIAAFATGTTAIETAVRATLGLASDDGAQTPEGVPEDVLEESEEEPEMVPKPKVVLEQVPAEGAMITAHAVTHSPSHGAPVPSSSTPRIAAAVGSASSVGLEVVLGIPPHMHRATLPWTRL
jgi:hypothetical protein